MGPVIIDTERLNLRAWTPDDAPAIVAMFDDPGVNEFVHGGTPIEMAEAQRLILRQTRTQAERGWCRWALELKSDPGALAGFCGVGCTFAPEIELGWTLRRNVWGRGLATEAARSALDYCFRVVGFDRIVSAIDPRNVRSAAVAERLGMKPAGTLELEGHTLTRYLAENPLPEPPRDPRFVRDCVGERAGSSLTPDAEV